MYGAPQYHHDDDDDVPPGFEGRRGRLGPQQAEHPQGNSSYAAQQYAPYAHQHIPSTAAHQQPSYPSNSYQQHQQQPYQQPYQQPAPASANGHGYSNHNAGPTYQQPLGRMGSGDMAAAAKPQALGAARQFQRALSGSVAAAQQQPARATAPPHRTQSGAKSPRSAAAANARSAAPDYGEYGNDSDEEYGATPNNMRRRNSSGKLHPHRGSSVSPGPGYHSSSSSPGRLLAAGSSYGRSAAPLPPAAAAADVAAAAAAASSTAAASPSTGQQSTAGAGTSAGSSTPGRPLPAAAAAPLEPDYGEFDADEEYGQEPRGGGRRRQTRPGGGGGSSSSRPRSSSRSGRGPTPDLAVAAARQALAGIAPPASGRAPRNAREHHRHHRQPRRHSPMSAERTAQLEAELQALRSRLLEAEAREVEAHMAVINLSSDNSSLQQQLSGMRQQKQQLEQMLLFGSDEQGSEEGSQYTGSHSSYSGQSEGPIDGEDWGNTALAGDADMAQEQQLGAADDALDGSGPSLHSVDVLESCEAGATAQGATAAAGGDVEAEIAEALAAAEAAASAAAAAGAAPAAAGNVPVLSALSLEEEIAQALAAAEAAGDAAVAAGSSAAAASDS